MTKSTTFSQTRMQLHLHTISKMRADRVLLWCRKGKYFVNVNLHCIVHNLKKDKRNVDFAPPPGKISAEAHIS